VTDLSSLNPDFRDLLTSLCDADAEFLIVGAYAVSLHGHPRTTGDIDVFVRPSPENAERVHRALLAFGAPLAAMGVTREDFVRKDVVVQIGLPPRRIDLLTEISGVSFDEAWSGRSMVAWGPRSIGFLGLEELLRNKRASGRAKDLVDIEALEKIHRRKPS
jgi:hypothetical protein